MIGLILIDCNHMGTNICMNVSCSSSTSIHWKKGWKLRSGGFADLCDNCGSAYEQLIYCDTFHLKETGWRECTSCRKRLHCGCIVSKSFLELLDNGGVECISCVRSAQFSFIPRDEEVNRCGTLSADTLGAQQTFLSNKIDVINRGNLMFFGLRTDGDGHINLHQSHKDGTNGSLQHIKGEQVMSPVGDFRTPNFSNLKRPFMGSLVQTSIGMNIGNSSENPNMALRVPGLLVDGRDRNTLASSFQQGHNLMKIGSGLNSEESKDVLPQARVARPPPVEGRCRPQLLPRYWPKITDQELQQIAGDTNSTIVPLFEKVLSASDAGRIGRLVLPKACAEAYFPRISQPEGLPIRIQDIKGKDWMFQFRFWPNNNSRMYVLEGVTPCIQSMQLQAGDTVTFSRIDPEGKLLMGFRKTSSPVMQENQMSVMSSGVLPFSGAGGNRPIVSGYSNRNRSSKGYVDPHLSALSDLNKGNEDITWHKNEDSGGWPGEGLPMQQPLFVQRSRKIGSKGKRLLMDTEDALELKLTWEEAQDLLRPPPTVKPSVVIIEDHEFEEYEEPPVFGKKTIFTARSSGGQDQWVQCDSCSRWRKLPADVLLPSKWTCADNAWDPERSSCSVPDELSRKELDNFLRMNMDIKKRRVTANRRPTLEREPSALDALASVAALGDSTVDPEIPSVATTTRHPRHRPGCSCIVCIQPPSGKGPKHKPTCNCNVCMTVRRRFETLMMRKKKRQELEGEMAQKKINISIGSNRDAIEEGGSKCRMLPPDGEDSRPRSTESKDGRSRNLFNYQTTDTAMVRIDLNCDPDRDQLELLRRGPPSALGVSMMTLLQEASLPLETYLKQNGLTSLAWENHQGSSSSHGAAAAVPPHEVIGEDNHEGLRPSTPDENDIALVQEREIEGGDEGQPSVNDDPSQEE
ncbi:hypothetical protein MKW92_042174 [Papaver armeniacum]|nr:hypothetical protein MKW92_042174 [Papaver armeniacum]